MSAMSPAWKIGALTLLGLATLAGCAVEGGGYGGPDVGVSYAGGFFEPSGYEYGGWGRDYRVGPPRGHGNDHSSAPGRRAPSIPTAPRAGGRGGARSPSHR
jgi:hypothetical protein